MVEGFTTSPDLREAVAIARRWTVDDTLFGISWAPLAPTQIPYARLNASQSATLFAAGKIAPLAPGTPIRSSCRGFLLPQEQKRRLRPIFEPLHNAVIQRDLLPPLTYPSRRERRLALWGRRYVALFDYAAYFDQIPLVEYVRGCHVLRLRPGAGLWVDGVEHTLVTLTRLPMGASQAPHVAQTLTWAVCEPLIAQGNVVIHTMIDNVALAADDEETFVAAVRLFLRRSDAAGLTLNERDSIPSEAVDVARWGEETARNFTFLGEVFVEGVGVSNTPRNLEKIHTAWQRMIDVPAAVTRRHVGALIGLLAWCAHTIDVCPAAHWGVLREFADLAATPLGWDEPARLQPHAVNLLAAFVTVKNGSPLPTISFVNKWITEV